MDEKHILITGITGFVGNNLVKFLKRFYPTCKITGISRHHPKVQFSYDFYVVNLLCQEEIAQVIEQVRPDYIFHLAGLVFSYDWDALYYNNVASTINLLEVVKKTNIYSRVVIAGSSAEYGSLPLTALPVTEDYPTMPQSPYGMTKLWQTLIASYDLSEKISVNTGRIFNIIGFGTPQQLSTGNLFSQLQQIIQQKQEPLIFVGNLNIKRDFLDIDDVCAGLVAIAMKGKPKEVYNICSGSSVSLKKILDLSLAATQLNLEIVVDNNQKQNAYVKNIYGCNAKIKRDTHWSSVITLKESINKALGCHYMETSC